MSVASAVAHMLARVAVRLAPASRRDWAAAALAELAEAESGSPSMSWAAGMVALSLGWRVQADGLFLTALAATPPTLERLTSEVFFALTRHLPASAWMMPVLVARELPLFTFAAALACWRPRLALWSALVVALVGPQGVISWSHSVMAHFPNPLGRFGGALSWWMSLMLSQPDTPAMNHPHLHNWQLGLIPVLQRLAPAVCGAMVGGGSAWLIRRRSARA